VFGVINAYSSVVEPVQFRKMASGQRLSWDDGSGSIDTEIYRSAADTLRTPDGFIIDGILTASGGIAALRPGTGYGAYQFGVTGDSAYRVALLAGGTLEWGNGTDARDTFLYRDSAGKLKTTGAFITNGGEQTFGANDSAGAGYRLVRVPNA
jgi:hypothetical protein